MHHADSEGSAWSGFKLLLRAFALAPNNWLVLGRNLIPAAGVYVFGWSAPLTVLSYWWDGLSLLALLVAAVVVRVAAESSAQAASTAKLIAQGSVGWIIVFGMFGIPYWMAFGALRLASPAYEVLHDAGRIAAFAGIVVGNAWSGVTHGFMTISDAQLKQRAQSGLHTLVVRAILMVMMDNWGLGFLLVPFMALVLTATEVWPQVLAEAARLNAATRPERA